jgi:hypothetical protein
MRFALHLRAGMPHARVLPDPSLKLTPSGMRRRPRPRPLRHPRAPGLRCTHPRAAGREREQAVEIRRSLAAQSERPIVDEVLTVESSG